MLKWYNRQLSSFVTSEKMPRLSSSHSPLSPRKTPRPPGDHSPRPSRGHSPRDAMLSTSHSPLPPQRRHAHQETTPTEDAMLSTSHSPLPPQKTPPPSRGQSPMKSSCPSSGHASLPLPQPLATTHLLSVYGFTCSGHFLYTKPYNVWPFVAGCFY